MIRQGLVFNDILEKKFKILRTSIMLGNLNNRDNIFREYEEVSREIDKIKNGVYEEVLAGKMYTTLTLEEEKGRLEDLIQTINKRINEKNEFLDDYIKITANFLDDLSPVNGERELIDYEIRLNNINEYLENSKNIEIYNAKLVELRDQLEEKYENKANNELINAKFEEELIEDFNRICLRDEYYQGLDYADIDGELYKLNSSLTEKETVMNTFVSSYEALVNAGISGSEREEYASYVRDARNDYYSDLEKTYILELYKLVLDKEQDYDKLYEKREKINNILFEREKTRRNLDISSRDNIMEFVRVCNEQFNIIKSQKYNLEDIENLILDINDCENKLNELELANRREEIQELVEEYSVEEVHAEIIEMPEEKDITEYENIFEEEKVQEEETLSFVDTPGNMVVKIREPLKINVKNASETAKLVMKKVVIVLEPKKFNNKRDKLKEAELELEKEKNKLNENSGLLVKTELHDDIVNMSGEEKLFNDNDVISTIEDAHDIFLDDDPDEIGIQLDTKKVNDNSIKETKELSEIKINASDPSNMMIPTEIFIEDPPKEKEVDLFKVTDPFLDDNEFELNDGISSDEIRAIMPNLGRIGTVKPNNALSKIESVVKENDDVVLPNLGLVDGTKGEVPIVSENYIS